MAVAERWVSHEGWSWTEVVRDSRQWGVGRTGPGSHLGTEGILPLPDNAQALNVHGQVKGRSSSTDNGWSPGIFLQLRDLCPAQNVATALVEVTKPAPPTDRVAPLEVTLSGGDRVVIPFTSNFKNEPVDCSASGKLELGHLDHGRRPRRGGPVLRGP